MNKSQGSNVAEWQSQQQYKEYYKEKSGFGLGYCDTATTVIDGVKWLFNTHEGMISAYCNVFESLINGSNLVTLFGKSCNMFGIKCFENLGEYFSNNINYNENYEDYPYINNEIFYNAQGLYNNIQHDTTHDHHSQFSSFSRYSMYLFKDEESSELIQNIQNK
ncbi:MAG: hypothetical protein LJI21_00640 [Wolbachia endosymbiont of Menacanthus eurysternus]|nr:MAG: hypothetical protein LJI21_00640 [Wolbachia endosymbiont of Menacanthus eurysternus]